MRARRATSVAVAFVLLATISPAAAVAAAPRTVAKVDAALVAQLAEAASADRLLVFVHANHVRTAKAAAAAAGLVLVDSFDRVGIAVATGTPAQIRAARTQPGVTYLEGDKPISFDMQTSHIATRGREARTHFQTTMVTTTTTESRNPNGKGKKTVTTTTTAPAFPDEIDGSGIGIAIIDSGIDGTHPMFQVDTNGDGTPDRSKVVRNLKHVCASGVLIPLAGPCTGDPTTTDPTTGKPYGDAHDAAFIDLTNVGNDTDTGSNGGHGTHVAGIAGGVDVTTSDGRELHGAAPDATLIGLSVGQTISVYAGAAGMNWVLEHHDAPCGPGVPATTCPPIRVVNNSWGSGGAYNPEDARSKIQDALVAEGVTVVWAAGNSGGNGSSDAVNPPAKSPTPGVLNVANYDDGGLGTRNGGMNSLSSRGKKGDVATYPDISAPGTNITAACRAYLPVCATGLDLADPDYNTISGTSMAAPHIAGIVAQLLEVKPTLTPGEIEDILEDTAHQFPGGGAYEPDLPERNANHTTSFDKGHGLVDVIAAVDRVLGTSSAAPASECTADGAVVTDIAGDADAVLGNKTPLPSEPGLDIREGRVAWDGTNATFTIKVTNLTDTPPQAATGEHFDYNFSYGGGGYYLTARWPRTGSPSFVLGRFDSTTGARTTLATLTGTFDTSTDTITTVLPGDAISKAVTGAPVMTNGDALTGFSIVGRRISGAVVPDADTANGTCPYTLGVGATA